MKRIAIQQDANTAYVINVPETASEKPLSVQDKIILKLHEENKQLETRYKRYREALEKIIMDNENNVNYKKINYKQIARTALYESKRG